MSKADEMFGRLGYEKEENKTDIQYIAKGKKSGVCAIDEKAITFLGNTKELFVWADYEAGNIDMQELNAINEKAKELGWL